MTESDDLTAPRITRRNTGTVTLDEVAALAGVSPSTVSRAIRSPDQVSVAAYEAVMRAVEATDYVPNRAASNLASNRSGTVAAVMPAMSYSVFADTVHGLEAVLSAAGIQLFLGATGYDAAREEQVVRAFLGRRPDGIVMVGASHTPGTRELLQRSRIPIVETWDWSDDPIDSLVGFSNGDAFGAIVEYVLGAGYRHPTFAGWLTGADSRAHARRDGFRDALARLRPEERVRILDTGARGISVEAGGWVLDQVLEQHPETDVLVCASDIFATGAVLAAQTRGLKVPGDIAITGFGDFEISRYLHPALTTIQTPNDSIGRRAGELILERIANPDADSVSVDLGFTLVARDSA
ncbi:LacI family DNA-binding transcriptional regulator [Microbacterium terricola]|uniref:LacI family transcriptional regulator n=1 Tax=Microbacterium terricola TaxID=344163 RepID=A0ABM8E0I2_9MICO|nr:LacI family DNA-binding transcriptional regulator [Microbacterium terricola]UYK40814.1 LacI family DNA-binding transcriptional regulator [Microbacterium terricola]BDV31438.1 LacI family transcriptional regulator [Microbacterium terricola]